MFVTLSHACHVLPPGIPIDMVGGTSIGAFVGALYCEERDSEKVERRSRGWAMGMAGYMDKIFDLTYPSTSYFTGRELLPMLENGVHLFTCGLLCLTNSTTLCDHCNELSIHSGKAFNNLIHTVFGEKQIEVCCVCCCH